MADQRRRRRTKAKTKTDPKPKTKRTPKVKLGKTDLTGKEEPVEQLELDEPKDREESIEVEDRPAVFDIHFHFLGVSNNPDVLASTCEAVIEEARQRGLFYQGGYQLETNTQFLVPRPGTELDQMLYTEE